MSEEVILSTTNLSKSFSTGGVLQHILKNLNIEIYKGEFLVIMGSSGAGKSTLLYSISGIDKPSLGEVVCCGENITKYSTDKLADFRSRHCGFVFQQVNLVGSMSLMDNVLTLGLLGKTPKAEIIERAKKLFEKVDIPEITQAKFPNQVSGGEGQRAAIVRALINNPDILFADEPTGALNAANTKAVLDIFTEFNREGQTVVMVTHDIKSARRADRIIYLDDGKVAGECRLGKYVSGDQDRHDRLGAFLTGMGW